MSTLTVTCRGERSFVFDPAKTALLVIDMQRHFLGDGDEEMSGESVDEEEAIDMREIVPRVVRLLDWARGSGLKVVHTREGYRPDLSDVSGFRHSLDYVGHESPLGRTLIRGEPGHDFIAELQPLAGETIIDKASFGAFYDTRLHEELRNGGIDHLILSGVTTQCCVHSTLREAVDRGYWCLTVADCCAASEPGLHDAALAVIAGEGHLFGWICDVADIETGNPVDRAAPNDTRITPS